MASFDCIQTFFADPQAVQNASEIMITSAEVFFKKKPSPNNNTSGYAAPGVVAMLCEVINGTPDPSKTIANSTVRVPFSGIYAFSDASVASVFTFPSPVPIQTGRFYGLMLKFEDAQYEVWTNKQGDKLVGTNTPSSGSGNSKDGKFYTKNTSDQFNPLSDVDLKYKINVARFSGNNVAIHLVNKPYEFLTISDRNGNFIGGEWCYKNVANATGTIALTAGNTTVVGTGTTLTDIADESYVVAVDGTSKQVLKVQSVTNTTHMVLSTTPAFTNATSHFKIAPVGQIYYNDNLSNTVYLVNSSANSTLKFTAGANVVCEISGATANIVSVDNYSVDQFVPRLSVESNGSAAVSFKHNFAYSNGTAFIVNTSFEKTTSLNVVNRVDGYDGVLVSRSKEVDESNLYDSVKRKSGVVTMTVNVATGTSEFSVPRIKTSEIDLFTHQVRISNTYLSGDIDTEVYKNGLATSKGITSKYSFANNRFAEDLRVYVSAFRPPNTDIRVYAKLHNSNDPETFDDKLWTPLNIIQNADVYSARDDRNDLVEYEFGLQQYPDSNSTISDSFTTVLSSAVITAASSDPSAAVTANDLVKLYNPLIHEDFMIAPVLAANSTTITLGSEVANNNLVGSGFVVDVLRYKGTAFNNAINGNIVRYFTSTQVEVDKFDSMQFKIVFLADKPSLVPEVDAFQAIGINAGATQ